MKWTTYISHSYAPSNNLQRAIKAYLISIDRVTFPHIYLDAVKANILKDIKELHKSHTRCTIIDAKFEKGDWKYKNDIYLKLGHNQPICDFYFIQCVDVSDTDAPNNFIDLMKKEGTI